METILFTVTNDLNYDQRMIRICITMSQAGYNVLLVGVKRKDQLSLQQRPYKQKRLPCFFSKGLGFYAEFNTRLFFYLLFKKADAFCCIDIDTILPVWLAGKLRNKKRVYDAHEYFSQLDEVVSRPFIYKYWHWLERVFIPKFKNGYTVCISIADIFQQKFGVSYQVIRNVPQTTAWNHAEKKSGILLYQGAVNKGRGLEKLIEAMKYINGELWICGDGNFFKEMKLAVNKHGVSGKVVFWGMLNPEDLKNKTSAATVAINPFERDGLNQYLSLSNKYFDYIQNSLPQVTMNFPEYENINQEYEVALLIDDLEPATIARAVNSLFTDKNLYKKLQENCIRAREVLNWQQEEKILLAFYKQLFNA